MFVFKYNDELNMTIRTTRCPNNRSTGQQMQVNSGKQRKNNEHVRQHTNKHVKHNAKHKSKQIKPKTQDIILKQLKQSSTR
jgi:hypothetical protein